MYKRQGLELLLLPLHIAAVDDGGDDGGVGGGAADAVLFQRCLLYTSPEGQRPRDKRLRYMAVAERAVASFQQWLDENNF